MSKAEVAGLAFFFVLPAAGRVASARAPRPSGRGLLGTWTDGHVAVLLDGHVAVLLVPTLGGVCSTWRPLTS